MSELQLPGYELVEKVASGGMGAVWRAYNPGRELRAIKVIHPGLADDPSFHSMLLREAMVMAHLEHEKICRFYTFGKTSAGALYLELEYIDGITFADVIRSSVEQERPLPLGLCCALVQEVCIGLGYAHRQVEGLVHRDISPQNVMLTQACDLKILDFGVAKLTKSFDLTQPGTIKGKTSYMSPEQIRGEALDLRSDIFSLGIVLWELLTGERLFKAHFSGGAAAAMFMVLEGQNEPYPSPRSIRPDVPPALEAIAMKALAFDREARYQHCEQLFQDLEQLVVQYGLQGDWVGYLGQHCFDALEDSPTRYDHRDVSGEQSGPHSRSHSLVGVHSQDEWTATTPGTGESLRTAPFGQGPSSTDSLSGVARPVAAGASGIGETSAFGRPSSEVRKALDPSRSSALSLPDTSAEQSVIELTPGARVHVLKAPVTPMPLQSPKPRDEAPAQEWSGIRYTPDEPPEEKSHILLWLGLVVFLCFLGVSGLLYRHYQRGKVTRQPPRLPPMGVSRRTLPPPVHDLPRAFPAGRSPAPRRQVRPQPRPVITRLLPPPASPPPVRRARRKRRRRSRRRRRRYRRRRRRRRTRKRRARVAPPRKRAPTRTRQLNDAPKAPGQCSADAKRLYIRPKIGSPRLRGLRITVSGKSFRFPGQVAAFCILKRVGTITISPGTASQRKRFWPCTVPIRGKTVVHFALADISGMPNKRCYRAH